MIATEVNSFQQQSAQFQQQQLASSPNWLRELRRRGLDRFVQLGIPTTREEDWRLTNLAFLAGRPFEITSPDSLATFDVEELVQRATLDDEFHRLVFVNGHYVEQWSTHHDLPAGTVVENLATSIRDSSEATGKRLGLQAEDEQTSFVALNAAFLHDGARIDVPADTVIERPIHLIFLAVGEGQTAHHPRNLITLAKNSRATVIESYFGGEGEGYFTNAVTEVELAESADLDHHKLQHEEHGAVHLATTQVHQQANSRFRSHYFSFGGSLVRNELNCVLDGEKIECTLNGLYMPKGDQLMDCRTRIDHAKPHCNSYEMYKCILDDQARGVFNGKIFVHQDAQKTDAKQSNQSLLLSDDAIINTKPQLEIYADDVRCTHGATIGELDEQAIYYLRSRGIPADLAKTMLIFAFANDVVQGVEVPAVRKHLEAVLLSSRGLPDV